MERASRARESSFAKGTPWGRGRWALYRALVFSLWRFSICDVKLTFQHHMKINSDTILYLVNSTAYLLEVAEKVSGARDGRAKDTFFTIFR